jgi:hydrogenase maturation protease
VNGVAPVLVIGYGNPARGDDAVGPVLAERLEQWLAETGQSDIEVLTDFQLNIEHVLDLAGRRRVLIIDASAWGTPPFRCEAVEPECDDSHTTHAVSPKGLLATYQRLTGQRPPPVELLSVPGRSFELGEPMSEAASCDVEQAWIFLREWCERAVMEAIDHA